MWTSAEAVCGALFAGTLVGTAVMSKFLVWYGCFIWIAGPHVVTSDVGFSMRLRVSLQETSNAISSLAVLVAHSWQNSSSNEGPIGIMRWTYYLCR